MSDEREAVARWADKKADTLESLGRTRVPPANYTISVRRLRAIAEMARHATGAATLDRIVALLLPIVGERGDNEGASDVVERLLRERVDGGWSSGYNDGANDMAVKLRRRIAELEAGLVAKPARNLVERSRDREEGK